MNREDFIKHLISKKGHTVKSFACEIGMPYSTLLSILKGSVGGASVDNVIKICRGLGITINDLQSLSEPSNTFSLTEREKQIIIAYRQKADMQKSVDTLLGIPPTGDLSTDILDTYINSENAFLPKSTNTK